MTVKLNMHSMIDAITNSSTETFSIITEEALVFVKDLIENVLTIAGSEKSFDDLFKISFEYTIRDMDRIFDQLNYMYEDDEDGPNSRYEIADKVFLEYIETNNIILKDTGERPRWFCQMESQDQTKVLDIALDMLGFTKESFSKHYMEDWERYQEGSPLERQIVITPLNDEAKQIEINLNDVIRTGEYSC